MNRSKYNFFKIVAILLLILLMILSGFILYAFSVKDFLNQSHQIKYGLAETSFAAPIIYLFSTAILTALGVPRLLFCSLAGIIFGFELGAFLSHVGTIMGAYMTFALARWAGREVVQKKLPKVIALAQSSQLSGWYSVFLMRQLPISGLYNSILLGLSTVSHVDFWIGTFMGFLPLGVTATLIGAGVIQADLTSIGKYLAIAACSFYLLPILIKGLLAQWRSKTA